MSVFICYSRKDSDFADKLVSRLMVKKIPVWIDKWELNIGDPIDSKIQIAITEASYLIVVLSRHSVSSEWCRREIDAALIREMEDDRISIVPLRIENCEIPISLKNKLCADFTTDFDDAFNQLYSRISRPYNDTQGRAIINGYLTDFGFDCGLREEKFLMNLDSVTYSEEQNWSVLSKISISANQIATDRFKQFLEDDIDWYFINKVILMIKEKLETNSLRVLVETNRAIEINLELNDLEGNELMMNVIIRRLGKATSRFVFFDFGNSMLNLSEIILANDKNISEEDKQKIARIESNNANQMLTEIEV